MNDTVIIAIISLLGTLFGTLGGIVASNKLVDFRLKSLEEKVEKHNSVVERTYKLESEVESLKETVHSMQG
ncbi:MAG: hypothetical protein MJY71_08120 [Bacteroidaceae bacterium]|nr:hypothetical protein [Bacteroidaceae bacterium]